MSDTSRPTASTPFDMRVMELDRFHLVADVIDRVPLLGALAAYAEQAIRDRLIEHKDYVARHGDDMPDVQGWTQWQASTVQRASSTEADNG
jgi:xylulose-5-phosphate/fructose-6-phosphate phosphoketolase